MFRLGLLVCATLAAGAWIPPRLPAQSAREVTLTGRVVTLDSVLKERGILTESDAIVKQFVLKRADGTVIPLLLNTASRALFLDDRLRNRHVELRGLQHPGLPHFEVVLFRVEEDGVMRVPEYWCEICSISLRFPQICPCCQGPTELRFKPAE